MSAVPTGGGTSPSFTFRARVRSSSLSSRISWAAGPLLSASTAVLALPPLDAMRLRSSSFAGSCDQHSALSGSASFEQRLPSLFIAVHLSVNWHLLYLGTQLASTYSYFLPSHPMSLLRTPRLRWE